MSSSESGPVRAILFDKDGTLIDFLPTWTPAVATVMTDLAAGDSGLRSRLAAAIGYDDATRRFHDDAPFIACPTPVWAAGWARLLRKPESADFFASIDRRLERATCAHLVPIGDPKDILERLAGRGLRLGLMSNDAEAATCAHAQALGIAPRLSFVAGYDTGFDAKPSPDCVRAFSAATGVPPSEIALVGDSVIDMRTAHAAGARAIAVLTGPVRAGDLVKEADAVIASVTELEAWLDSHRR